jgi:hypothetical protein
MKCPCHCIAEARGKIQQGNVKEAEGMKSSFFQQSETGKLLCPAKAGITTVDAI